MVWPSIFMGFMAKSFGRHQSAGMTQERHG